ncbi:dUTP diphosphatase [Planosporangium thailandense]|uniref:Deoxyuridine 5'-triphosphate nucleotidohydrolase n=1 Tax=Planosporangium thailandense TaxID=765197 RepID=A0ABX0XQW0_9ACTN|nr:dUTP diphosphatase [Planosporangium thailandense]NJC68376.1 dUTP diphosphatase [Planosporangium thailandense]
MEDKTAHTAQREDRSLRGPQSQADVSVPVELQRLDPDLPVPAYAHPGDAGADLVAAEDVDLRPGERALVRTGIAIALPPGYVGLVHPRSGLAARLGVTVLNAPGTVDAGYRGEILVNLVNHDPESTAKIRRGDRIAQLVVQQVERAHFHVVDQLPPSRRGAEGHGSTGGHAGLVGDWSGTNGEVE